MRGPVRGEAGIRGDEWPFDMCYDSAARRHAGLGRASRPRPPPLSIISMTHSARDRGDEKEKGTRGEEREKKKRLSCLSVATLSPAAPPPWCLQSAQRGLVRQTHLQLGRVGRPSV